MNKKPFESDLVMEEQINEAKLRAYNVGFDQEKFRLEPLVSVVADVITEFAFGYHKGTSVPLAQTRQRQKKPHSESIQRHNIKGVVSLVS